MAENWDEIYENNPHLYETFSMCQDKECHVINTVMKHTSFDNKRILEIGCGSGKYTRTIAEKCKKLFALEPSVPLLDIAKTKYQDLDNIKYIASGAENIPLEDNDVDLVFGSWVFGRPKISSRELAIFSELDRVLRPHGEVWMAETGPGGQFVELRNKVRNSWPETYHPFCEVGFRVVENITTYQRYADVDEAKRILGQIVGIEAIKYLKDNPIHCIQQNTMILKKVVD